MQIHQLSYKPKNSKSKRIGRGGKRGTYSGRGIKGQKARAGAKIRPAEREILKKIPKIRGYKFKPFRKRTAVVNLVDVQKHFQSGGVVSPESLLKKGLIGRIKGRMPRIKVLGKGELTKRIVFKGVFFSESAGKKVRAD